MKKLLIISLFVFFVSLNLNAVEAGDYHSYQDIEFEHSGAKLLEHYSESMYEDLYEHVNKRRFWGWNIFIKYKTEKVYYTKETLYVISNDGSTAITETFNFKSGDSVKKQYSVNGDFAQYANGIIKGFKLGMEQKMDYSIVATTNDTYSEEVEIRVHVDPQTKLTVQICGEGKISNGVSKYYRFWRGVKKGGWEVFLVTTEYYNIVKEPIHET